jgi:hypothetical protein
MPGAAAVLAQRRQDIRNQIHKDNINKTKEPKRKSFFSKLFGGSSNKKTNPNDHHGQLKKDGEFHVKSKYVKEDPKDFTNKTSKQAEKNRLDLETEERLDAAIKLGRFVTVRKRLRQIAAQRRKVQSYIRNIVIFTLFIVVFVLRNSSSDEDLYFSNRAVSEIFVAPLDFGEIVTVGNMWEWMEGTLCGNYYGQGTFDEIDNVDREFWLFGTYRKVGGIRIATLRVQKKSCGIQSKLFNASDNAKLICYGQGERNTWDEAVEDKSSYGLDPTNLFNWTGWNGTNAAKRRSEHFTEIGTYPNSHLYSSPAFGFVLPQTNSDQAIMSLDFAKNNGYVDSHTRMLMVDMTLMNGQTRNLMTLRFMFAMSKAGAVIPTYEFIQVETEAIDFLTTNFTDMNQGTIWMLLELIFYVYFVITLITKMFMEQCTPADPLHDGDVSWLVSNTIYRLVHYIQALGNDLPELFQTLNVFFYGFHWYFRVVANSVSPRDISFDTDSYIPLRTYTETLAYKRQPLVMVTFCVFFRFVFYIGIVPELGVITNALTKSIRGIVGFFGVFFFVTLMYILMGIQLFGSKLEGFRSLVPAIFTIFEWSILGESGIEDMLSADRTIICYFYILSFYIVMAVMLLNMAIAIISDAYAEARADVDEGKDADVKIGREIKRYFMLKLWKIPFLGRWLKNKYINYGIIKKKRIQRAISGDMSLHQQIKLQQAKLELSQKEGTSKSSTRSSTRNMYGSSRHFGQNNNGVSHEQRMAKTAAEQTLRELRELSTHLSALSNFVHARIDSVSGGKNESVEDFLFAHKAKKNRSKFGNATPSFVLDGVSARNHAVVNVVEIKTGKKNKTEKNDAATKKKKNTKEYGVL